MNNYRKVSMYIVSFLLVIFLYFLVKSLTFEGTGIEINNASFMVLFIGFPIPFVWVVYAMASLLQKENRLTLLRKINIILPIFLIFTSIWILPNFIDVENKYIGMALGNIIIGSMIAEITTFFIKKQN